jgi:hypothetical protein
MVQDVRVIADYAPATGEAGEMLVDGVDAAQLGRGLVVVLPDLFRRSASCRYRRSVRPEGVAGGRTPMYEIPMMAVFLLVLGVVAKGWSWGW